MYAAFPLYWHGLVGGAGVVRIEQVHIQCRPKISIEAIDFQGKFTLDM